MKVKYSVLASKSLEYTKSAPIIVYCKEDTNMWITNEHDKQKEDRIAFLSNFDIDYTNINVQILRHQSCYSMLITDNDSKYGMYVRIKPKVAITLCNKYPLLIGNTTIEFKESSPILKIIATSTDSSENYFQVSNGESIFIGNKELKDDLCSLNHLKIAYIGGKLIINDHGRDGNGSTNGVWAKKERVNCHIDKSVELMLGSNCFVKLKLKHLSLLQHSAITPDKADKIEESTQIT